MKYAIIPILVILIFLAGCQEELAPTVNDKPAQTIQDKPSYQNQEVKTMPQDTEEQINIVMETSKGTIYLELDKNAAPITVDNFIKYAEEGTYDGTIFHRVIDGFMIQGGGFTPDGTQKRTRSSIKLESQNGLTNLKGTIAMARTMAPNSATNQFFINVEDNAMLDYKPGNDGYAVFGKVVSGMDIVNKIKAVKTSSKNGMGDWPVEDVMIKKVYLKN